MPRTNELAIREAVGRRGVSVLVMPGDVALRPAADAPPTKGEGLLPPAVVNRTELAMPPAVTTEMAKGFTLYTVKVVMNGRGDEWPDLARTNLWR